MRAFLCVFLAFLSTRAFAGDATPTTRPGDRMIEEYFRIETARISNACLADIKTLDDWKAKRALHRQQLAEMLGLWPMPPRTDLKAAVTGKLDHEQFTVEMLHFQSMPGLYVTGNLYIPKNLSKPAPAILYVCGHALVKKNGISYGNKTGYQHHGAWFARNGYVCLVIDTLQLGEIEGIHHGTYREKMWWWHSRGYTPAGVEAWNSIRAIDYLQSRKEVDGDRIGITGRSGGGAYSWWTAALDDRVKVAVPVAGITDMQNHVVDGCIEGHCDCMYMNNTYRWDFAQVAALVAPRPLLLANSDKDTIFPLDGVERVHWKLRHIYHLYKADDKLGLLITEGPHKDTQELQVPALRWFNRFLKNDQSPLENYAVTYFQPEQLKVFKELPADQINTRVQETLVPMAAPPVVPQSKEQWEAMRDRCMAALRSQTFRAWPEKPGALDVKQAFFGLKSAIATLGYDYTSQEGIRLRLYVVLRSNNKLGPTSLVAKVVDEEGWAKFAAAMRGGYGEGFRDGVDVTPDPAAFDELVRQLTGRFALAYIVPRGIGPSAWNQDEKKQAQIKRRFALLGQTLDGMRVWDVVRAIDALRDIRDTSSLSLRLTGEGRSGVLAMYASLFSRNIEALDLSNSPSTHRDGPDLLNVLKFMDIPAAAAMAAERTPITLHQSDASSWEHSAAVAKTLGWPRAQFQVVAEQRRTNPDISLPNP